MIRKFFLLFTLIMSCQVISAEIKDAFVLVDVSGSMNRANINAEGKQMIEELLLGKLDLSKWSGWQKVPTQAVIPNTPILINGSHCCIIPFGNQDRVNDYKKHVFQDENSFNEFYNSSYPTIFKDKWTYLTLAKAFVGSVAVTEKIRDAYVFIYTDGRPESTHDPYNSFFLDIVDRLEVSNSYQKIGTLRKNIGGNYHFDIEVWKFKSYTTLGTDGQERNDKGEKTGGKTTPPTSHNIIISSPSDGKSDSKPHKEGVDNQMVVTWTGGPAKLIIYQKKDKSYSKIPPKVSKELYTMEKNAQRANITFHKSGDYKILVRGDNGGSDERYFSISNSPFKFLIPLLLIIVLLGGGFIAYQQFFKPTPNSESNWDNSREKKNGSSRISDNDDW